MYQALYRKWRPKTFADVVGQEHITDKKAYRKSCCALTARKIMNTDLKEPVHT